MASFYLCPSTSLFYSAAAVDYLNRRQIEGCLNNGRHIINLDAFMQTMRAHEWFHEYV